MKTSKLDFPYPARRVYTACKAVLRECGEFRSIDEDDRTFRLTASKGFLIFGENLTINVIATSSTSCEVTMRSSDKLLFNPFKIGNNVKNIMNLDQYIRNEVFRLCDTDRLRIRANVIAIRIPDIHFKK